MKTGNIELLHKITDFITSTGIPCREEKINKDTFLPGIDIVQGAIVYDTEKMLSPGDLLHEAGHIAVLLPEARAVVSSPNVSGDLDAGGCEMAAIAWSWAALKHLDIAPEAVFHKDGYHGDSETLIQNFSNGRYIGVPLLQWFDMTKEPHNAAEGDVIYPAMKQWLRCQRPLN